MMRDFIPLFLIVPNCVVHREQRKQKYGDRFPAVWRRGLYAHMSAITVLVVLTLHTECQGLLCILYYNDYPAYNFTKLQDRRDGNAHNTEFWSYAMPGSRTIVTPGSKQLWPIHTKTKFEL
jgi:hypothetical protein